MPNPYLSIIVPCFREADRLPQTFPIFKKFAEDQSYSVELVFVHDGSPDNTLEVLHQLTQGLKGIQVIDVKTNHGKGHGVVVGMEAANGQYRLFADADNSTPIEQANKLLENIDSADIVIGSRYVKGGGQKKKQPFIRIFGARFLNIMFRIFFPMLRIKDTQCGFKMFSEKVAQDIFPKVTFARFSFDTEVLALAHKLGYKIKEVPVDWYDNPHSTVKPLKDGLKFIKGLILIRWNLLRGVYKKPRRGFVQI